ncbi:unnamed protein product [Amoebophrya sp. A25]|nr:unnamed protein product [Amoebophrya sp. A25]|eukprot:GSA25T00007004001.1
MILKHINIDKETGRATSGKMPTPEQDRPNAWDDLEGWNQMATSNVVGSSPDRSRKAMHYQGGNNRYNQQTSGGQAATNYANHQNPIPNGSCSNYSANNHGPTTNGYKNNAQHQNGGGYHDHQQKDSSSGGRGQHGGANNCGTPGMGVSGMGNHNPHAGMNNFNQMLNSQNQQYNQMNTSSVNQQLHINHVNQHQQAGGTINGAQQQNMQYNANGTGYLPHYNRHGAAIATLPLDPHNFQGTTPATAQGFQQNHSGNTSLDALVETFASAGTSSIRRNLDQLWTRWLTKNERLRHAGENMLRRKEAGGLRLEEFRALLDITLQDKMGFEIATYLGSLMLSLNIAPNSHFFSIYCLIFSRDPSLEGYEKVSQMFQYVRPLNAHTFASLIRCHGALHDSISAVRVLKHFREILHTLSANDLKYRFTVYQAAHDVCLKSEWSHQVQKWIEEDQVTGVDGGRKPPPPEGLPKIYLTDERPAVSTSEAVAARQGQPQMNGGVHHISSNNSMNGMQHNQSGSSVSTLIGGQHQQADQQHQQHGAGCSMGTNHQHVGNPNGATNGNNGNMMGGGGGAPGMFGGNNNTSTHQGMFLSQHSHSGGDISSSPMVNYQLMSSGNMLQGNQQQAGHLQHHQQQTFQHSGQGHQAAHVGYNNHQQQHQGGGFQQHPQQVYNTGSANGMSHHQGQQHHGTGATTAHQMYSNGTTMQSTAATSNQYHGNNASTSNNQNQQQHYENHPAYSNLQQSNMMNQQSMMNQNGATSNASSIDEEQMQLRAVGAVVDLLSNSTSCNEQHYLASGGTMNYHPNGNYHQNQHVVGTNGGTNEHTLGAQNNMGSTAGVSERGGYNMNQHQSTGGGTTTTGAPTTSANAPYNQNITVSSSTGGASYHQQATTHDNTTTYTTQASPQRNSSNNKPESDGLLLNLKSVLENCSTKKGGDDHDPPPKLEQPAAGETMTKSNSASSCRPTTSRSSANFLSAGEDQDQGPPAQPRSLTALLGGAPGLARPQSSSPARRHQEPPPGITLLEDADGTRGEGINGTSNMTRSSCSSVFFSERWTEYDLARSSLNVSADETGTGSRSFGGFQGERSVGRVPMPKHKPPPSPHKPCLSDDGA